MVASPQGPMEIGFGGRNIGDLRIDHAIEVDAHTGAAVLRVPVPAPSGRNGVGPALVLTYSSGAGNSAFGAGWSLAGLPAIGIDTRSHVPRWDGSDGYQLGGEELVPWLKEDAGAWKPRGFVDGPWSVAFMRTRRGGAQVRVERWVHAPTGRVHFRTRDARNVVTIYGARPGAAARIADPDDEARTLIWLPELRIDPHGNVMWLEYAAETLDGIDRSAPAERRLPPLAQRYLKRIRYGNVEPLALDDAAVGGALPTSARFCFQLVLDYGDHADPHAPSATPDRAWPARRDPFSRFRDGFEVRTYRLCRRFLAFHDFAELGPGPTLVSALVLTHDEAPEGSTLRELTRVGHRRDGGVTTGKAVPPLRMTYAPAATETAFTEVPVQTRENLPAGLSARRTAFVDLLGEGLPGILTENDLAWYYKPNLGGGEFGAQALVLERPATRPGSFGFGDFDRDGDTDLVQLFGRLAGLYELDREDGAWKGFRPFAEFPHVEALGGHVGWVDLNGDGRPDIVVTKPDSFAWFASDGESFLPPVELPRPDGVDDAPTLAAEPLRDLFFADMTGDGLPDLVRVRNGRVEYWPSLGNGRFGERVVLDGAPQFAPDDEFDPARVRLIDLDGSGTTDVVYLGRGEVTCWINAAGNRLLLGPRLAGLPYLDNVSTVRVLDFLGDGRACLVWSSPLPGRESPIEYLPLTPALQPRLLIAVDDSLGRETHLVYASSATHYLRDVASGRGWSTRLPAHRPVVDRKEVLDRIGGTRSVQRFAYHDGYYDGVEREPRGFGQVDVLDADAADGTAPEPGSAAFAAPALVRTWFHLGTSMWGRHHPRDTYAGDPGLAWLAPHVVDDAEEMTPDEIEDGLRSIAGQLVRREIYAVDEHGAPGPHPFEVYQVSYRLRRAQPSHGDSRAAFSMAKVEEATWTYEQTAGDPRVCHHVLLEADAFDMPLRDVSIGYARRPSRPRDIAAQDQHLIQVHDREVINIDERDRFELGLAVQRRSYELVGIRQAASGVFTRGELRARAVADALAAPAPHHVELSDNPALGPRARLLAWEQSFYWNDARDAALPLRRVGERALIHHEEAACFAPAFISDVLAGRVDDARLTALGYVQRDGLWWQIDEVHHFTTAAQFSQRSTIERSDGAVTRFTYDAYVLVMMAVTDPLGNTTNGEIDYHQLAPRRMTDANGNVSEVRYDALGVIVAATRYGHVGAAPWGNDALDAVVQRTPAALADALSDPGRYLQGADRYVWYDLEAWGRDGAPTVVLSLASEDLIHDGAGGGTTAGRIQIALAYLDGFGRVLQEKMLVEDGPAIQRDTEGQVVVDAGDRPLLANASPRWRVAGHVVYDAKQRPGRRYEAFFSPSAAYESDDVLRHIGVATLDRYDALGRLVGQDFPNGTHTAITYGAWTVEQADPNDTVIGSTYGAVRAVLAADNPERQAYEHARTHAGTSRLSYLDPLGREVGRLERGGATAADRRTELRLDLAGRVRSLVDPRGLTAFTYRHDMVGRTLYQHSADAGETWSLPDVHDRVVTLWNSRGFTIEHGFDRADRPLYTHVRGGDGTAPLDHRVEEWIYGESLADRTDAVRRNLLGRVLMTRDGAGEATIDRYDPAGNALSATRRLRASVDGEPDWRTAVPLDRTAFTTSAVLDALGRVRHDTLADGTVRAFAYLPSGMLERVRVTTPDGGLVDAPILDGASFGARGERQRLVLGNGVETRYGYDAETHRLTTQTATRGTKRLQGIRYTYDPAGNLVRITDDAQEGPGALISGSAVPARRDYRYDAHYRLVRATGRVHQALLPTDDVSGAAGTIKGTRHLSFANGAAIEAFTRTYDYDASGNLRFIKHVGKSRSFTTDLWISTTSNRSLPALDAGGLPVVDPEGKFDGDGNLRAMPHLRRIEWTRQGALGRCVVTERPGSTDDAERYVYGGDGLRLRKVTTRVVHGGRVEVTEKVYLGDSERKRILLDGDVILERWTTHVGDGEQRIALIHRWVEDDHAREVDDVTTPRVHYQLVTHQGSSALELNQAGQIISYEEYFPYGGTAFIVGDNVREVARKDYRYSGKERDDFSGFYYYGFRYYVPWIGRWLSPDPIGPEDDLNLYQFTLGNPVVNVDPDGLDTEGLARLGSVSSTTAAGAIREFNNSRGLELGIEVTRVRRLQSGDWLIVSSRPIPPEVLRRAREIGSLEAGRLLADMSSILDQAQIGDPTGGNGPVEPGASGGNASEGPGPSSPTPMPDAGGDANTEVQNAGGNGGTGQQAGPGLGAGRTGDGTGTTHGGGNNQAAQPRPPGDPGQGGSGNGPGAGLGNGPGRGSGSGPGSSSIGMRRTGETPGRSQRRDGDGTGPSGRGLPGGVPGGQGTEPVPPGANLGEGLSGNNGGSTDPRLTASSTGQPPPPGVTRQGTDPTGSPSAVPNGTGQVPGPDAPDEQRNATDRHGNGQHATSGASGARNGASNPGEDTLDTLTRIAGYANFEFGDGSSDGRQHGIPGGHGSYDLGRFGQALYIAVTIASWIGPGTLLKGLGLGARLAGRGLSLLGRGLAGLGRVTAATLRHAAAEGAAALGRGLASRLPGFLSGGGRAIARSAEGATGLVFSNLSGGAKRLVRSLSSRGEASLGRGIHVGDLRQASEFLGREIGVFQHEASGTLRAALGTDRRVSGALRRSGEIWVAHTHPVYVSRAGDFARDIWNATSRIEVVIDWGGNITHFNNTGILANPAYSPINALGYLVGILR